MQNALYALMRTHAAIIRSRPASTISDALSVSLHTVRSWAQRNSIPAEHWAGVRDLGMATLEELAEAAAARASQEAA